MTQERMHPDDLRAIMAATYHAAAPEGITPSIGIDLADSMLAELARTAKPEDVNIKSESTFKITEPATPNNGKAYAIKMLKEELHRITGTMDELDVAKYDAEERAEKPEAPKEEPSRPFRVGDRVFHIDVSDDEGNPLAGTIVHGPNKEGRLGVKWDRPSEYGIRDGIHLDTPECLQLISNEPSVEFDLHQYNDTILALNGAKDRAEARTAKPEDEPEFLAWLQKARDRDNASRAEKAEARVMELEDAIKKHRSIVKGSLHWRGCDWDEELWSRVK